MKELEGYFLNLIELLESPIKKQIDSFISLSEKLKKSKEQNYNFELVASFNVNLLKEISNLDLYKIFVSNKQGKIEVKTSLFEKLRNNIDYIDEVKKLAPISFNEFSKRLENYDSIYKDNIKSINNAFDSLQSQSEFADEFLINFDKIRVSWTQSGSEEIEYTDKYIAKVQFLEPLKILCRIHKKNPNAIYILKNVLECNNAYDNIEHLRKTYSKHFSADAEGLEKAYEKIKQSIIDFTKM